MGTRTKESRRRIHSLILLIAFTAILLIVSTYAWFTTQKDVTISNLKGTIEVAESLEISLDGKTWSHKVDVDNGVLKDSTKVAKVERNIIPTEILPVSSTGTGASALMPMHKISYNGGLITEISDVTENLTDASSNETSSREGYFAFDIYLKNLSKDYDDLGNVVYKDVLKLNSNSYAWVLGKKGVDANGDGVVENITDITVNKTINTVVNGTPVVYDKVYKGDDTKGLQNTLRIAFARYGDGTTQTTTQGYIESGASQATIVANNQPGTSTPMTISAVSIWEPNANLHTESVFNSVTVKQSATVTDLFTETGASNGTKSASTTIGTSTFMKDTSPFNTFAIKHNEAGTASTTNPVDPNDWTQTDYFGEQKTVQTSTYYTAGQDARIKRYIDGGVKTLTELDGTTDFTLAANSVTKVRVYIWMEGQDPDCTNDNTHGGGIELQIGLVKSINDGNTDKRTDEINALPTMTP